MTSKCNQCGRKLPIVPGLFTVDWADVVAHVHEGVPCSGSVAFWRADVDNDVRQYNLDNDDVWDLDSASET